MGRSEISKSVLRFVMACVLLSLLAGSAFSADSGLTEIYEDVRFPYYKDGRLSGELLARFADAMNFGRENARIKMQGVRIDVYDTSAVLGGKTAGDAAKPPRLKMTIFGDRGTYEQVKGETGVEDVAHLEQNVKVLRYAYIPDSGKEKRVIYTTVLCDNATWNHSKQVLTGTGLVNIRQPGTKLDGYDFTYYPQRPSEKVKSGGGDGTSQGDNLGGWFEFKRDVVMTIYRNASGDKPEVKGGLAESVDSEAEKTVVTCKGLASYDIDSKEVHFEKSVVVTRTHMVMNSDFLRVMLTDGERPLKEIIAWSNVKITGRSAPKDGGGKISVYNGVGDYARYTQSDAKMVLVDKREGRMPIVQIGGDTISNQVITFDTAGDKINILQANGENGKALLQQMVGEQEPAVKRVPTEVNDFKSLVYNRDKNFAVFDGERVKLEREGLNVIAKQIHIDMLPEEEVQDGQNVKQMIATGEVVIRQGERVSHAEKADLDAQRKILRLFGPPQPRVVEEGVFRVAGKTITTVQRDGGKDGKPEFDTEAEGPGSSHFEDTANKEKNSEKPGDPVTVRYTQRMVYKADGNFVRYIKEVVAISSEYVLHSDVLDVMLEETPETDKLGQPVRGEDGKVLTRKEIVSIVAYGNSTFHWGKRHCKGKRIVRDMRKQVVVIYGDTESNELAEVWEEGGVRFRAPVIVATADGRQVHARGPGTLILPDDEEKQTATVDFEGTAVSIERTDGLRQVTFTTNVKMTRDQMTITGDKLVAYLEAKNDPEKAARVAMETPNGESAEPLQLKRMDMTGNVVVTQPTRIAKGDTGNLVTNLAGDIITLNGSENHDAHVNDAEGIDLIAPKIVANQGRSIVTATGPGKVFVKSYEAEGREKRRRGNSQRTKEVKYLLKYRQKMVYNSLSRKIKFFEDVKLLQSNINGFCDRLEVLLKDEEQDDESTEPKRLRVKEMFAYGNTQFQRFEPETHATQSVDKMERPGKTVFTKSSEAHYDVDEGVIKLKGGPPRPTAIQQVTWYDQQGQNQKSRDQMWADILCMEVDTGKMWGPRMRFERIPLPKEGPLEFSEQQ